MINQINEQKRNIKHFGALPSLAIYSIIKTILENLSPHNVYNQSSFDLHVSNPMLNILMRRNEA